MHEIGLAKTVLLYNFHVIYNNISDISFYIKCVVAAVQKHITLCMLTRNGSHLVMKKNSTNWNERACVKLKQGRSPCCQCVLSSRTEKEERKSEKGLLNRMTSVQGKPVWSRVTISN